MTHFFVFLVRAYQVVIRPVLLALAFVLAGPDLGPRCRYFPSCSEYAVAALRTHGSTRGLRLSVRRILRCHPWAPGGVDPVPPARTSKSTPPPGAPVHIARGV
jgi:putative membrane protein insertion efficiency factor